MLVSVETQKDYYRDRQSGIRLSDRKLVLIEKIRKHLKRSDVVFDYGCGDGFVGACLRLFCKDVVGFDLDTSQVAARFPYNTYADLNLRGDIGGGSSEVSLLLDVLEHIPDDCEHELLFSICNNTKRMLFINTPIGQEEEQPIDRDVDYISIIMNVEDNGMKLLKAEMLLDQYMFMVFVK